MNFLEEHAASIFGVTVYRNVKGYFPEASNIHSGRRDNRNLTKWGYVQWL